MLKVPACKARSINYDCATNTKDEEDEAPVGVGSEIITGIMEDCFFALDSQPVRIHAADVPVPYNHKLEQAAIPDVDDVYQGALKALGKI